jgi:quercetin dioxygenase-like cupin family protein
MAFTHLAFSSLSWQQSPTHPLEQKKTAGERNAILLRFAPGFADPNRCERSHVIYILEGVLELELEDETKRITAGEACWLDRGTWHRARNPGDAPVIAFVVSDL